MPHLAARRVTVQHLLNEQGDGGGGVELPLAPRQVLFTADASDAVPAQYTQRVVLDARERRRDTRHPWPPVRVGDFSTTILTGGRILRKSSKRSYGADLRLKLMALVTGTFVADSPLRAAREPTRHRRV